MLKLALVSVAALLCLELALAEKQYLTSGAQPEHYHGTDLGIKETKEARELSDDVWELNGDLVRLSPLDTDPDANLAIVNSRLFSVGTCLIPGLNKARKMFGSLKKTVGKCDFESYTILAKNYEAIEANGHSQSILGRIIPIFLHYQKKHADECRPKYRKMYDELKGQMDKDQLEKLDRLFSKLGVEDFKSSKQQLDEMKKGFVPAETLASIPTIRFTDWAAERALRRIVGEVFNMATKSPNWSELKTKPAKVFREYLFAPCIAYHGLFNEVLTPARFDAKIEEDKEYLKQPNFDADKKPSALRFFRSDYELTDAIAYNRICGSLLDEQKKLKKSLLYYGSNAVADLAKEGRA